MTALIFLVILLVIPALLQTMISLMLLGMLLKERRRSKQWENEAHKLLAAMSANEKGQR